MKSTDPGPAGRRVAGLDSLRIVLALTVAFSHGFGVQFPELLDKPGLLGSAAGTVAWVLAGNLYNGQAAVIVFFIISGFCIHYPYATGRRFAAASFLSRRLIRIGVPLAVCLSIGSFLFDVRVAAYMGLWSLLCEIIYYALYPLLRGVRARVSSWVPLYAASLAIAGLVLLLSERPVVSEPGRLQDFPAYGTLLTAVIGLPIWLLGCHLAEADLAALRSSVSGTRIWLARSAILLLSILFGVLKFHGHRIGGADLPNYLSLHIFAVPAFFWLRAEIVWHLDHPALRVLEWGGTWSYSLYVCHPLVIYALPVFGLGQRVAGMNHLAGAAIELSVLLALAYLFFLAIERPSHSLARMAARVW